MDRYKRSLDDLRRVAVRQWPRVLRERIRRQSVLELLLATQETFVSVLRVASRSPCSWNGVVDNVDGFPKALFLKHLLVLSDMGGEALNKLAPLSRFFPEGRIEFVWKEQTYSYAFKVIGNECTLTNAALHTDEKSLRAGHPPFDDKMYDTVMLILYGGLAINGSLPPEAADKCIIGSLIGTDERLDTFVRQNYIRVSRQVAGATANALGQITQQYAADAIRDALPPGWSVSTNAPLPAVTHTGDGTGTIFDIVVCSPAGKYCGIEVSFQVTTNSVIERKSRESEALRNAVHAAGHTIAYVIDGAGNVDVRRHAVGIICEHSDCTVAFSDSELEFLATFLKEALA